MFYKILKYTLMVVLVAIIVIGYLSAPDANQPTNTIQQPQSQSKFNF